LQTSPVAELGQALVSTGFAPHMQEIHRDMDWFRFFSVHTLSLRRIGSTALNLAYVAAGRFDVYYAFDNHVWDVAAGTVLVREAGGRVSNIGGGRDYDPYRPDALASNGPLHPILEKCFGRT
jgi:myo-inositol-1(or 4)-monophosphatase